jgi:hypothetical protein
VRRGLRFGCASALAVLVLSRAVQAADQSPGLEVGARVSFGAPIGNVDGTPGDTVDQTIAHAVPLWLEAGWRITPHWFVGGVGSYAPGSRGGALDSYCQHAGNSSCQPEDLHLGVEAHYHLLPSASWDPWFGVGSGYEWLRVLTEPGVMGLKGWEFANAQVGVDYRVTSGVSLGPFAALAMGEYDSWFSSSSKASSSGPVGPTSLHAWVTLGIKGTFDPRPSWSNNVEKTD